MRIALGIEYDGTNYFGWQRQPKRPTIQTAVEAALSKVANHQVVVNVAGRTDAGVHALGQVIHFDTAIKRSNDAWVLGTNSNLPADIRVHWALTVSNNFHARYSAVARQYRYLIYNSNAASALLRYRALSVHQYLNEVLMQEAANYLLGEHDFSSVRGNGCESKSPFRCVELLTVVRNSELIFIDIKANAFLLHMVRNIVGLLLAVGKGAKPPIWVDSVLKARDRKQGSITVAPHGLYLYHVDYSSQQFPR
jgi:tRNA pseudouridine38-40 synthase